MLRGTHLFRSCLNGSPFDSTVLSRLSYSAGSHATQEQYMLKDSCILVDHLDKPLGYASKKFCHVRRADTTPLHRAFSLFLFKQLASDPDSVQLLIQRRSPFKLTFPGLWSNTCCSHPLTNFPDEMIEENARGVRLAAQRKIKSELGIDGTRYLPLENIHYLTRFIYFARDDSPSDVSWAEHEVDYILVSFLDPAVAVEASSGFVQANPEEVSDVRWTSQIELERCLESCELDGHRFTPWFRGLASAGYLSLIWRWARVYRSGGPAFISEDSLWKRDVIIPLGHLS
ncbi:unnamed protein product [Dicrocoelium dendriticum]|nr:unnamed protein product [Dicrocoelium dendriticum]